MLFRRIRDIVKISTNCNYQYRIENHENFKIKINLTNELENCDQEELKLKK